MALTLEQYKKNLLGNGLIAPLRRGASRDFVSGSGEDLLRSCIDQILGTKPGELLWRPTFGMDVESYRHRNMPQAVQQLLADQIRQALLNFEPRLSDVQVQTQQEDSTLYVRVMWTVTTQSASSGNVLIGPVVQEMEL